MVELANIDIGPPVPPAPVKATDTQPGGMLSEPLPESVPCTKIDGPPDRKNLLDRLTLPRPCVQNTYR